LFERLMYELQIVTDELDIRRITFEVFQLVFGGRLWWWKHFLRFNQTHRTIVPG
jgi:hypothetical protein